uniref:KCNMB2 ball/chain domain-containing protein n=1 Tax=Astatotilapia calliptera TaxID=8154 RepID=A0AAX7VIU5_ASTCA
MFLWAGSKATDGRSDRRSIYQKIREYEVLDRRKTVTALRAGEDRAILLGLSMVFFSIMMYFVVGITILRSYSDRCTSALTHLEKWYDCSITRRRRTTTLSASTSQSAVRTTQPCRAWFRTFPSVFGLSTHFSVSWTAQTKQTAPS